jgi:serine/threonine-protein kinase
VILRTMQRHGIVLSDGGNIALTAESDRYTEHTWASLGITSRVFDQAVPAAPVRAQDFAVLDTGPRIVETYACVRNPEVVDPYGLVARTQRVGPSRRELTTLAWQGGAARVDIHAGTELVATVDNTGQHLAKPRPSGTPWRVCSAGTAACSEAAAPMPDRYLHAPGPTRKRLSGRDQP